MASTSSTGNLSVSNESPGGKSYSRKGKLPNTPIPKQLKKASEHIRNSPNQTFY